MKFLLASIVIAAGVLFAGSPVKADCACTTKVLDGHSSAVYQGCDVDQKACDARCTAPGICDCAGPCPPPPGSEAVGIPLPLGNVSVQGLIGRIIKTMLGLVGSLALVMFIYGGFLYMTSAGNEERVTKGKNTLVWAILGLVAVFGAYSVVDFVLKSIKAK